MSRRATCGHDVEAIDYDGDCTDCIREGKARKEPFEPRCWGLTSYEHYQGACKHFEEEAVDLNDTIPAGGRS